MLFGNWKLNTQAIIQIDGVDFARVYENKFLGITWKPHINHIRNKLSWSISVLSQAKHFLDHKSLHILYNSLILPYLSYCAELWGNTYKYTLQPLQFFKKEQSG